MPGRSQLRRLVGLFAFCYACLHLSVWVVLDHYFDWGEMWADLLKRRYITAGMAALTLLVPLAATSTGGMVRRLGGAAWRRLHRLVYLVAVLAALHFLWLAKAVRFEQYVYAVDRGAAPRGPALGRPAPSAAAPPSAGDNTPLSCLTFGLTLQSLGPAPSVRPIQPAILALDNTNAYR